MADINEVITTVTRKSWDRSSLITIDNTYKQLPKIKYNIQTATEEDGEYKGSVPKGFIDVAFDSSVVYPLLNPRDNSVIDPVGGNHFLIQAHVYSLLQYTLGKR